MAFRQTKEDFYVDIGKYFLFHFSHFFHFKNPRFRYKTLQNLNFCFDFCIYRGFDDIKNFSFLVSKAMRFL